MTIYGGGGERRGGYGSFEVVPCIENRGCSIDRSGGPFKSTFLVTFTHGYFVVAVFSRNETRRSGNWIPLSKNLRPLADVKTWIYTTLEPSFFFSRPLNYSRNFR